MYIRIVVMLFGLIIFLLKIAYPLYHSAKKYNNSDEEEMKRVLKYWCLLIFLEILFKLLELIIYEGVYGVVELACLFGLIYKDFTYSEVLYDSTVHRILEANKNQLDTVISTVESKVREYYESVLTKINKDILDKIVPSIKSIFFSELAKQSNPSNQKQQVKSDVAPKTSAKDRSDRLEAKSEAKAEKPSDAKAKAD